VSDLSLLALVAAAELVVLVLLTAVYLGHAAPARWMEHILARHREAALHLFAKAMNGPLSAVDVARLRALPMRERIGAFTSAASSLQGAERDGLAAGASAAGLVAWAQGEVRDGRWHHRLYALRILGLTNARSDLLPSLLRDHDPFVRAQAADWAAAQGSAESAGELARLLRDPVPAVRFAARDALRRLGSAAVPALVEVASGDGADAVPALEVAAVLADSRTFDPARRHAEDARPRVRAAALAALGALGGPESEELLVAALADGDAGVRQVAATAIGRLQAWRRAPLLAALLADADWDVRMAAADALRALGAPGLIVLRDRARGATSAGDLAQHTLDLDALELGSP
jgi:hypothetical protein